MRWYITSTSNSVAAELNHDLLWFGSQPHLTRSLNLINGSMLDCYNYQIFANNLLGHQVKQSTQWKYCPVVELHGPL